MISDTIQRIVFEGVDKVTPAAKSIGTGLGQLKDSLTSVQGAFAAIGTTIGVGAFLSMQMDIIKATAALDDMAESTGASVESLSAIRNVAKVGGQDFEGLTGQIGKMIKGLKDGSEEGGKTGHALEFLGVKAKDANGNFRDTGQIIIEVARALEKYADDGNKIAIIQDILGRGAERYAPLLKDIAEGTDLVTKVTKEQAAAAEEAEKNINRLKVAMEDSRRELTNEYIPALNNFIETLIVGRKETGSWATALGLSLRSGGDDPLTRITSIKAEMKELDERIKNMPPTFFGLRSAMEISLSNKQLRLIADHAVAFEQLQKRAEALKRELQDFEEDASGNLVPKGRTKSGYSSPGKDGSAKGQKPYSRDQIGKMQIEGEEEFAKQRQKEAAELIRYQDEERKKAAESEYRTEVRKQEQVNAIEQKADEEFRTRQARIKADAQADYDAFIQRQMSMEDREKARFDHSVSLLDQTVFDQEQHQQIYEAMYAEHQARLTEIEDAEQAKRFGISKIHRDLDLNSTKTWLGFMSLAMSSNNRKMFEVGKAASIAQAVIKTYEMAVSSYSAMASIPYIGPALGAAAAAAAIAFGLAQVQQIRSQQFGGGGGGGAAAPAPVFSANPITGAPVGSPGDVGPGQQRTVIVKIIAEGGERFTIDQVRELAEAIADLSEGGVVIS